MSPITLRRIRYAGVAIVLLLALSLGLRLTWATWAGVGAGEHDPFDRATYASAVVPDEENAALWLRAAAHALVLTEAQKQLVGALTTAPLASWTPEQRGRLHEVANQTQPAMALLAHATSLPTVSFGLDVADLAEIDPASKPGMTLNPRKLPLVELLWLQRYLYVASLEALDRGNQEEFLAAARPMALIATATENEAPLISTLIGVASERMYLLVVNAAVERPETPDATLDELERALPKSDLRAVWRRSAFAEMTVTPTRESARAGRLLAIEALVTCFDQPFGLDPNWFSSESARLDRTERGAFEQLDDRMQRLTGGQPDAVMLLKTAGRFQCTATARRMAALALALRRQGRSGAYPTTLAPYPEATRPDPFAGRPLDWRVAADGGATLSLPNGEELRIRLFAPIDAPWPLTWHLPPPARR
jgi:hypothetical protein